MRVWLSVITFVLIVILIIAMRGELLEAWSLLGRVDLWKLIWFVPLVLLSYFAVGETVFSYLRQKGDLDKVSWWKQIRMMLELNFVNHALPSGGASGVAYLTWRLTKHGVTASRATVAQVVRVAAGFGAFFVLLVIAVIMITLDGSVNRWIILLSSVLAGGMVLVTVVGIYIIKDLRRLKAATIWITRGINGIVRRLTRGRKRVVVRDKAVYEYLDDFHDDYLVLQRNKHLLVRPFLWSIVFLLVEVAQFVVVFWSLGTVVNPAPVLLAYGLATIAGFAVLTPGGSGAYEALMVSFLAVAGLTGSVAIAGVLLTRVLILAIILGPGYISYQHAVVKYGKPTR